MRLRRFDSYLLRLLAGVSLSSHAEAPLRFFFADVARLLSSQFDSFSGALLWLHKPSDSFSEASFKLMFTTMPATYGYDMNS